MQDIEMSLLRWSIAYQAVAGKPLPPAQTPEQKETEEGVRRLYRLLRKHLIGLAGDRDMPVTISLSRRQKALLDETLAQGTWTVAQKEEHIFPIREVLGWTRPVGDLDEEDDDEAD